MNNRMEKACFNILINAGNIPKTELDRIYKESDESQHTFTELIVESGLIKESDLLQIYSKNLGIPLVKLKSFPVEKTVLDKVPVKFAWYYKFFPLALEEKKLTIAVSRLLDMHSLDEIRLALGFEIEFAFSNSQDIDEMLKRHYGLGATTVEKILAEKEAPSQTVQSIQHTDVEDIEKLAETASVGQLVNQIILDAFKKNASDIHIEPMRGNVRVRYRIDGVLQEAKVPSDLKKFFLPILSRIKIMANLNIVEKRLPQDGKARVKTKDQSLDLRISSIPTPHGESMVIRILPNKMALKLEELGFSDEQLQSFKSLLAQPHGIIFVTGPTGSGKSTTLYAALNSLNSLDKKIITIEDPVEYEMEGVTQIQVVPEGGLTFARGLRSMLRHDPDVMMVGEVRDLETADTAIRVALTGHLILSTLHTNDAASGVTRLLDIGVEPYLVSSSVIAFIAQRLVRTICPHCKQIDDQVSNDIKNVIYNDIKLELMSGIKIYKGAGCDACNHSGYAGRIAIHEILIINDVIRKLIFANATAEEIKKKALQLGMMTLRQHGWRKVLEGITTPDEIIKVAPADVVSMAPKESINDLILSETEKTTLKDPSEKRVFTRINLKFKISFRPVSVDAKGEEQINSQQVIESEAENLSAGGMLFATTVGLKNGDVLELAIDLKNGEPPIQCLGRVIRSTQILDTVGEGNRFIFRNAISFIAISSAERLRIEKFCKEQIK